MKQRFHEMELSRHNIVACGRWWYDNNPNLTIKFRDQYETNMGALVSQERQYMYSNKMVPHATVHREYVEGMFIEKVIHK